MNYATYVYIDLCGDLAWFTALDFDPEAFKAQMRKLGTPIVAVIRQKLDRR